FDDASDTPFLPRLLDDVGGTLVRMAKDCTGRRMARSGLSFQVQAAVPAEVLQRFFKLQLKLASARWDRVSTMRTVLRRLAVKVYAADVQDRDGA
ncbi:MAG: hypothetical protein AB8B85_14805, partial [Paracoccaceae bacterium]